MNLSGSKKTLALAGALCGILAVVLALTAAEGQTTTIFTGIFTIVSFGSILVTINFILLGGTLGFFPSLCALGYCLVPICCSAFISAILPFVITKIAACGAGLYWCVNSVIRFFTGHIQDNRKFLGLYPCILLYGVITWIIFIH